jgi:tripartite ATP-independent transporter DctP family solute receptor
MGMAATAPFGRSAGPRGGQGAFGGVRTGPNAIPAALSLVLAGVTSSSGIIIDTNYHTGKLSALVRGKRRCGTGSEPERGVAPHIERRDPDGPNAASRARSDVSGGPFPPGRRSAVSPAGANEKNAGNAFRFALKCVTRADPVQVVRPEDPPSDVAAGLRSATRNREQTKRMSTMFMTTKFIAAAAFATALTAGVAQARDFRSADVHPKDYPTVMAVDYMGKLISQKTGGKYNIKVFTNSTLGSEADVLQQVKIGTLDMTRVSTATFHNIVPETMVPSFPFIFRDDAHFKKFLVSPVADQVLASLDKAGYVGLALYDAGARSMYTKTQVKTPADMKGMKIRVIASDLFVDMIGALGGSAIPIPTNEIYTALKTGLVEGAENNYPSYESMRHYEAAPFYAETQHTRIPEVVVFSKKVWDTLSPDDQKVIREAAKESIAFYQKAWDERMERSKKITIEAGAKYNDVNKADFVALVKPVWDKYAKTPEMKQLVQGIQDIK